MKRIILIIILSVLTINVFSQNIGDIARELGIPDVLTLETMISHHRVKYRGLKDRVNNERKNTALSIKVKNLFDDFKELQTEINSRTKIVGNYYEIGILASQVGYKAWEGRKKIRDYIHLFTKIRKFPIIIKYYSQTLGEIKDNIKIIAGQIASINIIKMTIKQAFDILYHIDYNLTNMYNLIDKTVFIARGLIELNMPVDYIKIDFEKIRKETVTKIINSFNK